MHVETSLMHVQLVLVQRRRIPMHAESELIWSTVNLQQSVRFTSHGGQNAVATRDKLTPATSSDGG